MNTIDRSAKIIRGDYLRFVRSKPCIACGMRPVDADHLKARSWREAKRNDFTALPLCREHHSQRGQIGDEKFQMIQRVNLWKEAFWLLLEFHMNEEAKEK